MRQGEDNDIRNTLCERLQNAAVSYYDFLAARPDLALSKITLTKMTLTLFGVQVELPFKLSGTPENYLFEIDNKLYSQKKGELEIIDYDEERLILHIFDAQKIIDDENSFALISDMKFLVENVRAFFQKKGELLALPTKIPDVPFIPSPFADEGQNVAIQTLLTQPLSYIWGAPGTGKTHIVLSHALASYVRYTDKIIAIVAPTNTALEQIIHGVLAEFHRLGIEEGSIYRAGIATAKFMERYPRVCENRKAIQKIKELQGLKEEIEKELELLKEENTTKEYLEARLELVNESMERHRIDSAGGNLKRARIVAATLDTYIMREDIHEIDFAHFFVDEAGLAPMIKVATLCKTAVPLTLLGDHKQISPICLCDKSRILSDFPSMAVWDMPSLGIEILWRENEEGVKKHYQEDNLTDFILTARANLTTTHRYGPALASLLNIHIYKNGLCSAKTEETQTLFIHADTHENAMSNAHEAHTIALLCHLLHLKGKTDYLVLTPFRKQVDELKHAGIDKTKVSTIHKAQGSEAEIVIISLTRAPHYHLSDSQRESGRQTLNVALSRVKNTLVIVGDKKEWLRYPRQLITQIIQNSQEWEISEKGMRRV